MRAGDGACAAAVSMVAAGFIGLPFLATGAPPRGDPVVGERVYARCIACHSPDRNRTGPLHCGLFGRVSGTAPAYDFSAALREAAITWNAETLDAFLKAPLEAVPGTTMGFAGVADDGERRDLIAYLKMLNAASEACGSAAASNALES